jgi:hypothetical protein
MGRAFSYTFEVMNRNKMGKIRKLVSDFNFHLLGNEIYLFLSHDVYFKESLYSEIAL